MGLIGPVQLVVQGGRPVHLVVRRVYGPHRACTASCTGGRACTASCTANCAGQGWECVQLVVLALGPQWRGLRKPSEGWRGERWGSQSEGARRVGGLQRPRAKSRKELRRSPGCGEGGELGGKVRQHNPDDAERNEPWGWERGRWGRLCIHESAYVVTERLLIISALAFSIYKNPNISYKNNNTSYKSKNISHKMRG